MSDESIKKQESVKWISSLSRSLQLCTYVLQLNSMIKTLHTKNDSASNLGKLTDINTYNNIYTVVIYFSISNSWVGIGLTRFYFSVFTNNKSQTLYVYNNSYNIILYNIIIANFTILHNISQFRRHTV